MRFLSLLYCFIVLPLAIMAQNGSSVFSIMSYNVENCFDTIDNPEVNDEEFLPESDRHWTDGRYYRKLQNIAQVIISAGEWNQLALVGLCEVENDTVMTHLIDKTSLKNLGYRYCMTHGQDKRGINVALLYQRSQFKLLGAEEIKIQLPSVERPTRNILHVWGKVKSNDTVDVFVCHMPSRSGGELESRPKRLTAASLLKNRLDSLAEVRKSPCFIVMGDFNDTPKDKSLSEVLQASSYTPGSMIDDNGLYDLFYSMPGSHKYRGEWSQLDHIIVNGRLLQKNNSICLKDGSNSIYKESFLLTDDEKHNGKRPFRTYYGFNYEGGFSDHLPLVATFIIKNR